MSIPVNTIYVQYILVGGFNPSENYESVGKDDIPYMKWKIKLMLAIDYPPVN